MRLDCIGRKSLHKLSTWIYANIFAKREKILSNSIFSAMGETVALDSEAAATSRLSSEFAVEVNPLLVLDKNVDDELALITSDMWYPWYNITKENNVFRYWNGGTMMIRIRILRVLITPQT